jgi:tRNA pseudouridine65 synthase
VSQPRSSPASFALPVLWQDDRVVVVDKPSGRLVHNSAWAGPPEVTVVDVARRAIAPDLVPVHRLDRGTSGALLLARPGADARALQAALTSASSTKRYVALVRGHVRAVLDVDHALDDDDEPGSDRRAARSRITPVACSPVDRCALVVVELFSGRKHQARRHCKHASHPILGDATHGKGPLNRAFRDRHGLFRLALHCARLALPDVLVDVRAPLPADLLAPLERLFPGLDVDGALDEVVDRHAGSLSSTSPAR